ncbi:thioesterase domain-containing protein [Streptomyces sp. NPDC048106]|uniref:thioesterase II family protein n=1 Tax=Streptomyces sp. NPDC048106 TaxID=3155750 RepID=UPI0034515752
MSAPCSAPREATGRRPRLDDGALWDAVVRMGGIPAEVAANTELRRLLLSVFRADFTAVAAWRHKAGKALSVPITVFAGSEDEEAPPSSIRAWSQETSGAFEARTVSGGHFFHLEDVDRFADSLRQALARDRSEPGTAHAGLRLPVLGRRLRGSGVHRAHAAARRRCGPARHFPQLPAHGPGRRAARHRRSVRGAGTLRGRDPPCHAAPRQPLHAAFRRVLRHLR